MGEKIEYCFEAKVTSESKHMRTISSLKLKLNRILKLTLNEMFRE